MARFISIGESTMSLDWKGGDELRRTLASRELERAGFSLKAITALFDVGVFAIRDLLREAWTDEEAGRRFASLRWRLSVSPTCTPKVLSHIELVRTRLSDGQQAA